MCQSPAWAEGALLWGLDPEDSGFIESLWHLGSKHFSSSKTQPKGDQPSGTCVTLGHSLSSLKAPSKQWSTGLAPVCPNWTVSEPRGDQAVGPGTLQKWRAGSPVSSRQAELAWDNKELLNSPNYQQNLTCFYRRHPLGFAF